jgi:hypothetical protein
VHDRRVELRGGANPNDEKRAVQVAVELTPVFPIATVIAGDLIKIKSPVV